MKSTADFLNALLAMCVVMSEITASPVTRSFSCPEISCQCKKTREKAILLAYLMKKNMDSLLETYTKLNAIAKDTCTEMEDLPVLQPGDRNDTESHQLIRLKNGLLFINAALKTIITEQQDLNPQADDFHTNLNETQARTTDLTIHVDCILCVEFNISVLGKLPHLNYPSAVFQRKKWSCSLIKRSSLFLSWAAAVMKALVCSLATAP